VVFIVTWKKKSCRFLIMTFRPTSPSDGALRRCFMQNN
jgi:hypothetical protein